MTNETVEPNDYSNLRDIHPFRLLMCGDWHGNLRAAKAAIALADRVGADGIVHVGDLGWCWNGEHAKTFDIPLEEELTKRGIFMVWADGNHDNHDVLRSLPVRADGFVECSPHLFWSPRANRWNWAGREFGTLGGAFSIDHEFRKNGWDVWKGLEEVHVEDIDHIGFGFLDVLITHEAPADVPVRSYMKLNPRDEQQSFASRSLLRRAVENTRPELVFSGHWHQRLTHDIALWEREGTSRVEVLDMDGTYGNAVILDLDDLKVTAPPLGWQDWTRRTERKIRSALARDAFHTNEREHALGG